MVIKPEIKELKTLKQSFSEEEIKNETMLFSSDYDFAKKNGDGLTHLFLDNIPDDWKESKLIIDSRVHMLMPGWCPCIPGWHHDDVPRSINTVQLGNSKQPNYINPEYYSEHLLYLVNSHIAPTEFFNTTIELEIPKEGIIYDIWNKKINEQLHQFIPNLITQVKDSTIYQFDWKTFHRGVPAVGSGWRYFIRASRYWKDKEMTIPDENRFQRRTLKNQIRKQVQVYLPTFEQGW